MAKTAYLDENDRKLLFETKQKLDEATKLMGELMETIDVLSDPDYGEWFNHSRYHRGVKAFQSITLFFMAGTNSLSSGFRKLK